MFVVGPDHGYRAVLVQYARCPVCGTPQRLMPAGVGPELHWIDRPARPDGLTAKAEARAGGSAQRPPSARALRDEELKLEIGRVYDANFMAYGADEISSTLGPGAWGGNGAVIPSSISRMQRAIVALTIVAGAVIVESAVADAAPPNPAIFISDATVAESGPGSTATATFVVSVDGLKGRPVTVGWATADQTASAPADYASASGLVTLTRREPTATVTVTIVGDGAIEGDEAFSVVLSNPTTGSIGDGTGVGTITNDDVFLILETTGPGLGVIGVDPLPTDGIGYQIGTIVTVVAIPASDSEFVEFLGGCTNGGDPTGGSCTFPLLYGTTVIAHFKLRPYLQVAIDGPASSGALVTGPGISCPSDCSELYTTGDTVELTATPPGPGETLTWLGCQTSSGLSCTVQMNEDQDVTAYYDRPIG